MPGPSKRVKRHLTESALDGAIDDAQSNGDSHLIRRLCMIKNLYVGDSVTEAAGRVGVSQPTASRWTDRWNEGGVDGLRPGFGGGRPPKLSERERAELADVLDRRRSRGPEQVQRLIEDRYGVSYSRRHVSRLLEQL